MPEYSVVRKVKKNAEYFEIECQPLEGEEMGEHREANNAVVVVNWDLQRLRSAGRFANKEEMKKPALQKLSEIIPESDASALLEAALEGKEGVTVRFEKTGDIYSITERNF